MKIRNPLLVKAAGRSAGALLRTMMWTNRVRHLTEEPGVDPFDRQPERLIYCLWHDSILIPLTGKSRYNEPVAALVSQHRDGTILDEFMSSIGVRSVRGSQNHGGVEAMRRLMREIEKYHVFITPDGPRGPRRETKQGIVYLASRTGRRIVPTASYAPSAWRIQGSWTDQVIPKPFSTVYCLIGKGISVPPDLDRSQLETQRVALQAEMVRLEEKLAAAIADGSANSWTIAGKPHKVQPAMSAPTTSMPELDAAPSATVSIRSETPPSDEAGLRSAA